MPLPFQRQLPIILSIYLSWSFVCCCLYTHFLLHLIIQINVNLNWRGKKMTDEKKWLLFAKKKKKETVRCYFCFVFFLQIECCNTQQTAHSTHTHTYAYTIRERFQHDEMYLFLNVIALRLCHTKWHFGFIYKNAPNIMRNNKNSHFSYDNYYYLCVVVFLL